MLVELKGGFPMEHTGRGGSAGMPTGFGQQTSVIVDEVHRQFFRKISEGLNKVQAENPLPIIATGVERFLAFWGEVAPEHTPAVSIEGSYDFMSEAELSTKLWPQIETYFRAENHKIIESLDVARGNNTYAGGFDEVIEVAQAGRIRFLVISDDETANPKTELAIRLAIGSGAEVFFVPAEELEGYSSIAADLRF
jgi:stalled ribosome rescue protein Dom34